MMIELASTAFIILFVVVDPVGIAPMFAGLTSGDSEADRKKTALKGVCIAGLVLLLFTLAGEGVLRYLHVNTASFSIAGGILLFLLAIDMVLVRDSGLRSATISEQAEAKTKTDISVFPLAIPMIAGPGSLTTILLLQDKGVYSLETIVILGVLLVVLVLTYSMLVLSVKITGILGETGTNVITRVFGIILAALATQFILNGLTQTFPGWTGS
jgi:multiple antibiotic resistance protein